MLRPARPTRVVLLLLATLFAAVTVLASVVWMRAVRAQAAAAVEIGFNTSFEAGTRTQRIDEVVPGGPAARSGLRVGDRITAIDGVPLADADAIGRAWLRHRPGEVVSLAVARPGEAAPFLAHPTFQRVAQGPLVQQLARQVHDLYPLPFVIVGLAVLFLRVEDRNAWLLALLFSCFVATPGLPNRYAQVEPALRAFGFVHAALSLGLIGPLFYFFFAVFPARSPLDQRWPWLKWAALAAGVTLAVPGIPEGGLRLPAVLAAADAPISSQVPVVFVLGCFGLGFAALVASYRGTADREARRKSRVIFWGTLAGVLPALASVALDTFTRYRSPAPLSLFVPLLVFAMPVSFAYAVVKHRVLEIPVLLRRSARYLFVQRGFTFLLSLVSIGLTLLFAAWFTRYLRIEEQSYGVSLGAMFGTVMLWSGLQVHRRVSDRIDRAFFRSSYDARVILEDLAAQSATATERAVLALLLARHLENALHPVTLAVYFDEGDGRLQQVAGDAPAHLQSIAAEQVAEDGPARAEALAGLDAECVVPIRLHGRRLAGLLALGRRLSDEPYSGEDLRLLDSVARQAGIALENMALAEEIARRIESERRAAREMEIARDVQARLLPERPPCLATLDCAARCIQARAVGGDCYDFLDLGAGRVGFVVADVSGKGIHAALLMAKLQAHLRSQVGTAPAEPVRVLSEVNRLLYQSTATQHYATVFLGIYEDATRRFRYVNCGHNPPVLLREEGGDPVRLPPTAPVVGLFEQWQGHVDEVAIRPGDVLAVFSDGVTEAMRGENEFGEAALIDHLRAGAGNPATVVMEAVLGAVERFSGGAQSDDLTLLVLRGTP